MKFQAPKYGWRELKSRRKDKRAEWHRRFAFWPVAIPEAKYDEIVVPRHYVWLERYAWRYMYIHSGRYGPECKSYAGELPLWALIRK